MPLTPNALTAPFPWFGGKAAQAADVWAALGNPTNYVEPFFGSGAVLLNRPDPYNGVETINDADGFVCNFWRAIRSDPDAVAGWCNSPPCDLDLWARHRWLVERAAEIDLASTLERDAEFFDAKIAGWWVWGICCWIGSGWCTSENVAARQRIHTGGAGKGVHSSRLKRQRIHTGHAGMGVHSLRLHRKRIHTGDAGMGVHKSTVDMVSVQEWLKILSNRLRRVRILCGDWSKAVQSGVLRYGSCTGVYLDPPYGYDALRTKDLYSTDSADVASDVLQWCKENGDNPSLRIALAGYEGEHDELESMGWSVSAWKPPSHGYAQASQAKENVKRERLWCSPHCVSAGLQSTLFDLMRR